PSIPNPGQEDLDGDGQGNVCDSDDASINLTQVRLRGDTSAVADNGSVSIKGDFLTHPPTDVFDPVAGGITIRVKDVQTLDQSYNAICTASGAPTRFKCVGNNFKATFKPLRTTPAVFRFKAKAKRQSFVAPFEAPVRVTITHDTVIDRTDTIM